MSIRLVDTTFSAVNISSAAIVYTHTAAAATAYRYQVTLDNAAGGGDYVVYLAIQYGGAGSVYPILPKTTATAAVGETTIAFATINLDVYTSDVVKVYVDGLAGDTSVNGKIKVWADNYISPSTFLRQIDVDASGYVTLSDGTLTAAKIASSAISAAKFAAGAITAAVIATDAIDADALATDAVTEIWSAATRTLTTTAAAITAAVTGSNIAIHRGDTLSATFTGLASNTGYVTLDFTVKRNPEDADSAAIIKIRKNASGLSDGLLYLNGAAGTAAQGSITVNSATSITVALAAAAADDLIPETDLYYDIQLITASAVTTLAVGVAEIDADITRSIT